MVIDGHTGIEHNIPVAPVYKDVLELWGASEVGYTPTLIVNYGGLNAEVYWYQKRMFGKMKNCCNLRQEASLTHVPDTE